MAEATSAIPVGVYPYLTVKGGKAAIDFYTRAFGASEEYRAYGQDNERIMHSRLRINGFAIMLSDYFEEFHGGAAMPAPTGIMIHLEVDDADRWFKRAVDAGATVRMEVADQFWGDRYGQVVDPFGQMWSVGAPIKK